MRDLTLEFLFSMYIETGNEIFLQRRNTIEKFLISKFSFG